MSDIVATEVPERTASKPLLETWGKNERMRHIPPIEWIVQKVDGDLRRRIGLLHASFVALPTNDPRWAALEAQFRAFCRAIDRLGELARHGRASGQPLAELAARIDGSLNSAVASLRSVDPTLFPRRYPFQSFERSKGEALYGALLLAIDALRRLTSAIRTIDPAIDEHLLAGLVQLQEPFPERPLA